MHVDFQRGDDGDLLLENSEFSLVGGHAAIAQFFRSRLESFTREWFLNLQYGGVDRARMLVKNPRLGEISALRRAAALSVPGVVSLSKYKSAVGRDRNYVEIISVITEDEEVVSAVSSNVTAQSSGMPALFILGDHGGVV
jgi:hypothetical protein